MHLVATDALFTTDAEGQVSVVRGSNRISLPNAALGEVCRRIFAAFAPPGRDREEVIASLPAHLRPAFSGLVDELLARGFLQAAATAGNGADSVFWADHRTSPHAVAEAAAQRRIHLIGRNALTAAIDRGLRQAGLPVAARLDDPKLRGRPPLEATAEEAWRPAEGFTLEAADGRDPPLLIAATDLGAETWLRPWNAFAIDNGSQFLAASIKDNRGLVGPYVRPGEGPCLECARGRVNAHRYDREASRADEADRPAAPAAFGWHPMILDMVAAAAVAEALRQALGALPPRKPGLLELDPAGSGECRRHPVHRLPRCPACSPGRRHAAPLIVHDETTTEALLEAFR